MKEGPVYTLRNFSENILAVGLHTPGFTLGWAPAPHFREELHERGEGQI